MRQGSQLGSKCSEPMTEWSQVWSEDAGAMLADVLARVPASEPEENERAPLPSDSKRIPCRPKSGEWQVLDSPQKAVATVSMIDCLWEKLTKVSDDLELLQAERAKSSPDVPKRNELEELAKAWCRMGLACVSLDAFRFLT